jgi:potassium efflux system protein
MKKPCLPLLIILFIVLTSLIAQAQVPARHHRDGFLQTDSARKDSSRNHPDRFSRGDSTGQDSSRIRRGGFGMSSLFADSTQPTSSDYQQQIEKSYVVLNNIDNKSNLGLPISNIKEKLTDTDSVLAVLKDNLQNNTRALNLRNLQVFSTLLQNIQTELRANRALLDSTENKLSSLKNNMKTLMEDTLLKQLLKDSTLRLQFAPQLKDMRETWRSSTRHLRQSLAKINNLQTHNSSNSITTSKLLETVNTLLATSATRIFSKEYNYLWEKDTSNLSNTTKLSFEKAYAGERKALHYYFKDSGYKRVLLLLIGALFFLWTWRNIRGKQDLSNMGFEYLPSAYILSTLIIMFSIAPLFDLHAPAAYIEAMQFLLLVVLTIICWKKWPRNLFAYWIVMAVLYLCFSFTHHLVDPGFWQRSGLILLNILSIVFGQLFLSKLQQRLHLKGFLRMVIVLHNILNVLAIICNICGRVSLAQILGSAAIFAFTQAIGLAVFSKIFIEAILLQIVGSRVRRNIPSHFNYEPVLKGFGRPVKFLVIVLWLIVFATNLNIYTSLLSTLTELLTTPRNIGNASFTIGGVLLFFMIIWIAHLLQKYVGYFFGDTGNDEDVQNKGQRSRLLIARLILLCVGYLLAVAASGVPVDKITIVLGALGVGIGLGLQNIVNNFVSGIILIFDRPLQIGDLVEVGSKSGRVREIGLRSSTLITPDGAEVIIPNGDILSQQITNWTLTNNQQRLELDMTVTGSKDMEIVAAAIKDAVMSSKYIFESRAPQVLYTKVNENGFDLKLFYWCRDVLQSDQARSEILILLHKKLNEVNLHIE